MVVNSSTDEIASTCFVNPGFTTTGLTPINFALFEEARFKFLSSKLSSIKGLLLDRPILSRTCSDLSLTGKTLKVVYKLVEIVFLSSSATNQHSFDWGLGCATSSSVSTSDLPYW